jgi:purine nucleosidase
VTDRVIIDADFGLMNDDAWAVLLALREPRLDVLGVCVTAGNFDLTSEARDARHVLDRAGHEGVPVLAGAGFPLVHERGPWEDGLWGGWARDAATLRKEPLALPAAVDFIVEEARSRPGEVTLLVLGPLTTAALAIQREPRLPSLLRRIVVMGGSIVGLPRGGGNVTPTAEFNVWVDPEAARAVLRSGAALTLVPLNAIRLLKFEESDLEQILAAGTRVSALFRDHVRPAYDEPPGSYDREALYEYAMCDPTTVATLVLPDAFTTTRMFVEVETAPVLACGTTYGYVIGDPSPADVPYPQTLKHMKREHLLGPDAWAWTGVVQPSHPPYWTTPPAEVDVVLDVDVSAVKAWFLETITR